MYRSFTPEASPRGSPQPSPRGSPQPSPRGSPQPSPRGSPQPSPRGSPQPSPRGSPQPSPRGSPQPSPRGSPQPSPRGSPQSSPRGSPQPSPRASPQPSPRGSRSPSPAPRSRLVAVISSDSSSKSSSRLKTSFSCPDLLDESADGSCGGGLSSSVRVAVTTSSSSHLDSSHKQRNSNPGIISPRIAAAISNPFGPRNMIRARAWGRRKASLDVPRQVPISKYKHRGCSTLITSRSKQQAQDGGTVDEISFGPSPVCILISRAGDERVTELEEVDDGLFPHPSKFLGGSMDKVKAWYMYWRGRGGGGIHTILLPIDSGVLLAVSSLASLFYIFRVVVSGIFYHVCLLTLLLIPILFYASVIQSMSESSTRVSQM